jgi:glycerophosphoryl diester phosphodiesterase
MLHEVRECFGYVDKMSDERCEEVHIPTLEDVMQWARQKPQLKLLFLDIKVPDERIDLAREMITAVEEIIRRYPPTFKIVYETASRRVLREIRDAAPDRDYTLDIEPPPGFVIDPEEYSAVGPAIEAGNAWATPSRPRPVTFAPWVTHRRIVESDQRRRSHHNGTTARVPLIGLVPYTINDPKEMRTLIALGVDGIQSDRPEILRAVAETMGRRLA